MSDMRDRIVEELASIERSSALIGDGKLEPFRWRSEDAETEAQLREAAADAKITANTRAEVALAVLSIAMTAHDSKERQAEAARLALDRAEARAAAAVVAAYRAGLKAAEVELLNRMADKP